MNERKKIMDRLLKLRVERKLKYLDITVAIALMCYTDKEYTKIKNITISNLTGIDKSDVSKSIKRLKESGILLSNESGYKFNID